MAAQNAIRRVESSPLPAALDRQQLTIEAPLAFRLRWENIGIICLWRALSYNAFFSLDNLTLASCLPEKRLAIARFADFNHGYDNVGAHRRGRVGETGDQSS